MIPRKRRDFFLPRQRSVCSSLYARLFAAELKTNGVLLYLLLFLQPLSINQVVQGQDGGGEVRRRGDEVAGAVVVGDPRTAHRRHQWLARGGREPLPHHSGWPPGRRRPPSLRPSALHPRRGHQEWIDQAARPRQHPSTAPVGRRYPLQVLAGTISTKCTKF